MSWALAFNALAFRNIQDNFFPALSAVDRKVSCFGIIADAQEAEPPLADRTGNPSVLYDKFTTILFHLQ